MQEKIPPLSSKQLEPLLIPITDIHPHPDNYKIHNDDQLRSLKASLKTFSWTTPIKANLEGTIIAGHGMYQAAIEEGYTHVPVEFCALDRQLSKAYLVADNETARRAETDQDQLNSLLSEISEIPDFDIEATGFSLEDLDGFLNVPIDTESKEDEFSENENISTDIKLGDIFKIGNHWLMCGDAANKEHVNKLIGNNKIDLIYYDPPYEIQELWNLDYSCNKSLVFSDNRHIKDAMCQCLKFEYVYEFIWDNIISWYLDNRPLCRHRTGFLCSNDPGYDSDAMVLNDGKERKKQHRDTNLGSYEYSPLGGGQVRLTSVFSKSKAELPAEHGKPVEWIAPIIAGAHVNNVLDLFGGAGSTIIACEQVGISCFTMEIDPVKCQNIKNRVEDYLKIEHT